ncbi:MAG: hypothetical protein ABSE82_09850, partial [Nitrososphaerales archaeon]
MSTRSSVLAVVCVAALFALSSPYLVISTALSTGTGSPNVTSFTSSSDAPLAPSTLPPSIGCWIYTRSSPVWTSVPCVVNNNDTAGLLVPSEGGGSSGVYGDDPSVCCLVYGQVNV